MKAKGVDLLRKDDYLLRAGSDTKLTTFAALLIKENFGHRTHSQNIPSAVQGMDRQASPTRRGCNRLTGNVQGCRCLSAAKSALRNISAHLFVFPRTIFSVPMITLSVFLYNLQKSCYRNPARTFICAMPAVSKTARLAAVFQPEGTQFR